MSTSVVVTTGGVTGTPSLPLGYPSISVVIPTLNEARNLPHVLPRIPPWVHEIIVVDGFSVDDTLAVAARCRADVRSVTTTVRGKGAAIRAGIAAARGDIVAMLDADGSTDPAELPAFVGTLLGGADVALGSRFALGGGTSDMELHRNLGNRLLTLAVRLAFGTTYSDLCYGYFAFWRDVWPQIDGPFTGFEVETVLHIRAGTAGLRVAEVPSFEGERIWGISNLHAVSDGVRILRSICRERMRNRGDQPRADTMRTEPRTARSIDTLPGRRIASAIDAPDQ